MTMKDRFWQIVAALFSGVVAVAMVILTSYLSQRSDAKEFTAEVISSGRLLNEELISTSVLINSEDFRLIYQEKDIPNVAVSNIRMTNSGRKPIRTDDIEAPISIGLNSTEIISSRVISSAPPDLRISTENSASEVIISKALLNPGDEFTVEIVSIPKSSNETVISGVKGRIAGINKIIFKAGLQERSFIISFLIPLVVFLVAGLISGVVFTYIMYNWSYGDRHRYVGLSHVDDL